MTTLAADRRVAVGLDARPVRWRPTGGSRGRVAPCSTSPVPSPRQASTRSWSPTSLGTLEGPDLAGLAEVVAATTVEVIASGVGSTEDLVALAALEAGGRRLAGAIVGKAERGTHRCRVGGDDAWGSAMTGGSGSSPASMRRRSRREGHQLRRRPRCGRPCELAACSTTRPLVFLDITASSDRHDTTVEISAVGGQGVHPVHDRRHPHRRRARQLLMAGADKVSINTAAVSRPELVRDTGISGPSVRGGHRREAIRAPALPGRRPRQPNAHRCRRTRVGREVARLGAGEISHQWTATAREMASICHSPASPMRSTSGDRQWWRRHARPPGGGSDRRRCCGAGREHLPLRRAHDCRGATARRW